MKRLLVGAVGATAFLALAPACSEECQPGLLGIVERSPAKTDRVCGDPDGPSTVSVDRAECTLDQCRAVCPTIRPRDGGDTVVVESCRHVIDPRRGGSGGEGGQGGAGGATSGGSSPTGGAGQGGAGQGGAGQGGAGEAQTPYFECSYDVATLYC